MTDLPDKIHLPEPVSGGVSPTGGAPLDPQVRAELLREKGDEEQLAWDQCTDPAHMLTALAHAGEIGSLIPIARFMEVATATFQKHGGQVDPMIFHQVMRTVAKMLGRGKFHDAVVWLRHAWGGVRNRGVDSTQFILDVVRDMYPCRPEGFGDGAVYGEPMLKKALLTWRALRRLGFSGPREQR